MESVNLPSVASAAKNAFRSDSRTSQRDPARVAASFTRLPSRAGQPERIQRVIVAG